MNFLLKHVDAVVHDDVAFAARSLVGGREDHPRPSGLVEELGAS